MKKYFAVSDNASEFYENKKQALNDLKNFGDDVVRLYTLKYTKNIEELDSEDLIAIYKNGEKVDLQ